MPRRGTLSVQWGQRECTVCQKHARISLLPAVAQFLSRLPADAGGDVVVALPQTVNPWGYFPKSKLKMHVLSPHEFEARILEFARDLTKQGTTDYGFFAGEFANAQSVRGHFKKALKLDKTSQISTAYWRR